MLQPPRKSRRVRAGLAVVAGGVLLWLETARLRAGDAEAYFWVAVAGLMIVLGLAGVFARSDAGPNGPL